jgi:uncharacterized membrane protein
MSEWLRSLAHPGQEFTGQSDERAKEIDTDRPPALAMGPLIVLVRIMKLVLGKVKRESRKHWAGLAVVSVTLAYILTFSYLSIAKYRSFHATVADLGLHNQIYWLILSGGWQAYAAHGFAQFYPFPFAKLAMFIILPFYAIYPHPETLLVIQATVLGAAALPLYLLSLHYISDRRFGLVIVLAYLSYFPMQGANLFDFHPESLFPLLFVLALYNWHTNRKLRFGLFSIASALVGPGALLTCLLFITYAIWKESEISLRRLRFSQILHALRRRRVESAVLVVLFVAFTLEYLAGSIVPYISRSNPLEPSNSLVSINAKLQYFILLLAPLGFIALWDRLSLLLLAPFVANALLATSSALWNPFVLHYSFMILPILFLGTIRGARVLCSNDGKSIDRGRLRHSAIILLTLTTTFAVVYAPLGPLNSYVQGGYFAGNHDLAGITSFTEHYSFVWRLISLIPPDASVLTENDLPQASGRPGFYVVLAGTPPPPQPSSGQYDYILADATVEYLTPFNEIVPYINTVLADRSFGILAMGQGAILLKRGYQGAPLIFEALHNRWTPDQLTLNSGQRTPTALVHRAADGNSFSFWSGPYVSLPPGRYVVNFTLQVESIVPTGTSVLTIDVTSNLGNDLWISHRLTLGEFSSAMAWKDFTLEFTLPRYVVGAELRGMSVTNVSTIAFGGVSIFQTSGV